MTIEELNEAYLNVLRQLSIRRPDLFRAPRAWAPGGVVELRERIAGLLEIAARCDNNVTETRRDELLAEHVCANCPHQTPCGYCVHRGRGVCVVQQELGSILEVLRDPMHAEVESWPAQ